MNLPSTKVSFFFKKKRNDQYCLLDSTEKRNFFFKKKKKLNILTNNKRKILLKKMNTLSIDCSKKRLDVTLPTQGQVTVITVTNLVLTANVTANALIIYILVHTKQIAKITCKIIFVLRVSDSNPKFQIKNPTRVICSNFIYHNAL